MKTDYLVRLKPSAEKELDRLPSHLFDRVVRAIRQLVSQPRPANCKRLRGSELYRVRVGDYRVLYTVDDPRREVEIVAIGHRREVYRGL